MDQKEIRNLDFYQTFASETSSKTIILTALFKPNILSGNMPLKSYSVERIPSLKIAESSAKT
jgi:hypothetical protein